MKRYKILHLLTGYYVSFFEPEKYIVSVELYKCNEDTVKYFEERMIFFQDAVDNFIEAIKNGHKIHIYDGNIQAYIPSINEFDIQEINNAISG